MYIYTINVVAVYGYNIGAYVSCVIYLGTRNNDFRGYYYLLLLFFKHSIRLLLRIKRGGKSSVENHTKSRRFVPR